MADAGRHGWLVRCLGKLGSRSDVMVRPWGQATAERRDESDVGVG